MPGMLKLIYKYPIHVGYPAKYFIALIQRFRSENNQGKIHERKRY